MLACHTSVEFLWDIWLHHSNSAGTRVRSRIRMFLDLEKSEQRKLTNLTLLTMQNMLLLFLSLWISFSWKHKWPTPLCKKRLLINFPLHILLNTDFFCSNSCKKCSYLEFSCFVFIAFTLVSLYHLIKNICAAFFCAQGGDKISQGDLRSCVLGFWQMELLWFHWPMEKGKPPKKPLLLCPQGILLLRDTRAVSAISLWGLPKFQKFF